MDNKIDKINYLTIMILLIAMPVIQLVYIYSAYTFKSTMFLNIHYAYFLWLLLPILMLITLYNIHKKRIKFNKYTVFITVLLLLFLISAIFAIDKSVAIYGFGNRKEGFLSILAYYIILINCSTFKDKKYIYKLLNLLIIIGLVQVIYGILQTVFRVYFVIKFIEPYMASGLCGNPNFFGSYIVLALTISIGGYLLSNKYNKLYLFASLFLLFGLVTTQSLTPFLGFVLSFIFMMIVLFKKFNIKRRIIVISLSLLVTFTFSIFFTQFINVKVHNDKMSVNYTLSGDLLRMLGFSLDSVNEITNTDKELNSDFGTGRLEIWSETLKVISRHPITGVGIDNFYFDMPQIWGGIIIDKAHNDYLQIMATSGIATGLVYLGFLFLVFIKGIKSKNKLTMILLFSFIGYSIQAFANISVVEVTPIYFMIIGFIISLDKEKV